MTNSANDTMIVGRWQWVELQLFMGKFPQGMTLVEYVRRVPTYSLTSKDL